MKKLVYIIAFISSLSNAQDTLVGYAPDYVGKKVTLFTYQDYITRTKISIGEGEVDFRDSIFRIQLQNKNTLKGIIQIENTEAEIYVAPNTSYQVYYEKPLNQAISFDNQYVNLLFFGLDSTDINYRLLQYNQWFDTFISYNKPKISHGNFGAYLDTFKTYIAEEYADVDDDYFLTHVRYNVAKIEQTLVGHSGKYRLNTYLEYIKPFPIYFENEQYMDFVLKFYHMNFEDYPPEMENNLFEDIQKSSPTLLMKHLSQDLLLERTDVREIVMVEKLGKLYYSDNRNKANIITMLDSISARALNYNNALAAKNVKRYLTSLEPGFPAPSIALAHGDSIISWNSYTGKYVYFSFFSTWDDKSVSEMKLMDSLHERYGDVIHFLTLCTDEKKSSYEKYLANNPEIDWDVVYIGNKDPLLNDFRVESFPQYFLIDQQGFIVSAPAPGPSPNGEYESIEKTLFNIQQAINPTEEFRKEKY